MVSMHAASQRHARLLHPAGLAALALLLVSCRTPDDPPPAASPQTSAATAASTSSLATTSSSAATGASVTTTTTPSSPPSAVPAASLRPHLLFPAKTTTPHPLVLFLHGYGASARLMARILDLPALAKAHDVTIVAVDATEDGSGRRAWNATDACCDFDGRGVDDVAALRGVIEHVKGTAAINPRRVFVVGYSNGAFMAQRLACELSGDIAGIASLSGVGFGRGNSCRPRHPVRLLHVHGDADKVVAYGGGHVLGRKEIPAHPSVVDSVGFWAKHNRCQGSTTSTTSLAGKRVAVRIHSGCQAPVELWTVLGGGHIVGADEASVAKVLERLLSA